MAGDLGALCISMQTLGDVTLVLPVGVLDMSTYGRLRDHLFKTAADHPSMVLVDIDQLRVPASSSFSVFSSVANQAAEWPGVPIALLVRDSRRFAELRASPLARFVSLYPTLNAALDAEGVPPPRQSVIMELSRHPYVAHDARQFVQDACHRWGVGDNGAAVLVAGELVENAVRHTEGSVRLRVELRWGRLAVAVSDESPRPAAICERTAGEMPALGLALVARVATAWGCTPTGDGKIVWAVLRLV